MSLNYALAFLVTSLHFPLYMYLEFSIHMILSSVPHKCFYPLIIGFKSVVTAIKHHFSEVHGTDTAKFHSCYKLDTLFFPLGGHMFHEGQYSSHLNRMFLLALDLSFVTGLPGFSLLKINQLASE